MPRRTKPQRSSGRPGSEQPPPGRGRLEPDPRRAGDADARNRRRPRGRERARRRLASVDGRGNETVIDIGGGNGSLLVALLKLQPGLRGIVFDLPETVRDEVALGDRIEFVEGSFFERVPEGGVYILSTILHDWDDERAAAILHTIRAAARPDSRLLILDQIVPPGNEPGGGKWLFLLVVDAGEGARPQTHEHLAILRLLGVERGVVAVTKADAVDAETLELAVAEAQELVPGAEVVPVSAKTREGLDELRAALGRVASGLEHERPGGGTRLYIDRAFTLTGVGTVVTGTLWSGAIGPGDALEVQPSGLRARARTVHVHDVEVPRAEVGQRVAVNLPGIDRRKLRRGDALVEPGYYPVSWRLDVALEELEPVPAAVTVHIGTSDVSARVVRSGRFAQLRLREPVVAARGDRVVFRTETTVA